MLLVSIVAVAVGAACGALLRWQVSLGLNALFPRLPPGTFAVNVVGGYLVGVAATTFAALPELSPLWRLFVVTGFLGGFTTFSSFSAEVVARLLEGRSRWAAATVAAHVGGSVAATLAGVATVLAMRPG